MTFPFTPVVRQNGQYLINSELALHRAQARHRGGFACIHYVMSLSAASSRRSAFHICWKSFVSKLVGEDSLTGFLFVYASNGAVVRNVDV